MIRCNLRPQTIQYFYFLPGTEIDDCGFDPYIQSREYYLNNLDYHSTGSHDFMVSFLPSRGVHFNKISSKQFGTGNLIDSGVSISMFPLTNHAMEILRA